MKWNCCQKGKAGQKGEHDNVLYSDSAKGICIMLTSELNLPDYLAEDDDLKLADMAVVVRSQNERVRYQHCKNTHAFREEKLNEEKLMGHHLDEVLPPYVHKFMIPIYLQTLDGAHCSLTILWNGALYVLRTFPIRDHNQAVVAAMSLIIPFNTGYNNPDIRQFMLSKQERTRQESQVFNRSLLVPKKERMC